MLRTIRRNIARNRLIDMGVSQPNRNLKNNTWRNLLFGDLKKMADRAAATAAARRSGQWKRWKDFWKFNPRYY